MLCTYMLIFILLHNAFCIVRAGSNLRVYNENSDAGSSRKLLANNKHPHSGNRLHNSSKDIKITTPYPVNGDDSVAGTEVAVLFIVVVVVLSVIGMVIYFIRKFDQLNRSLPTYRYSSLKTEINGYGPDGKESQYLVNVSTEEEDEEEEEEEDLDISPPTLLVRSQTVMPTKPVNGQMPVTHDSKFVSSNSLTKIVDSSIDSDDELLQ